MLDLKQDQIKINDLKNYFNMLCHVHSIQMGSEAHSAFYTMGRDGRFSMVKVAGPLIP
jgi:hypothetical protein